MPTLLSNRKRARRVMKPLPRSDAQLDELSQVTPADIEASKAEWQPIMIGSLLDAELIIVDNAENPSIA